MGRKHADPPPAPESQPAGAAASGPAGAVSAVDDLVHRGTQAIEEYDYELARTLLTRAFELSSGGEAPARALLALLVDHLAADHEALEIGERLGPEAQRLPELRLLLALAAARSGKHDEARALVRDTHGAGAADVLLVLAKGALAASDTDEAARLCEDARSRDPAHPGVRETMGQIALAREQARRPLETKIAEALGAGALDRAQSLAEQVFARFPESDVARRTIRTVTEQQRARDAERLANEAEEALLGAERDTAGALLRRARTALTTSPPNDALAARLARLEADLERRSLDAKVREAVARLAESDPRPGLLLYVSLPDGTRAMVRAASPLPMLDGLETLLGRRTDPQAAVGAILALAAAAAVADHDPRAALEKLAAHERALAGVAEASRLGALLRQRILDDRRRRLAEHVTAAQLALETGDAAGALEALGKASLRELGPAEREAGEALRARAKALVEQKELEATCERLRREGDPLGAREVAEQLLARAGEADRERRRAAVQAAAEEARRAFGVWVSGEDDGAGGEPLTVELGAPLDVSNLWDHSLVWIDAEAQSIVVPECCGRWVFVVLADLASGRVRARVVLRAPESLDLPSAAISPSGKLTLAGDGGAVLELSIATWDPLFFRPARDVALRGEIVDHIALAPGTRFAWISARLRDDSQRLRVVDLERRRVARDVSEGWWFQPIIGLGQPLVASSQRDAFLSLHHPGGAVIDGGKIGLQADVRAVTAHPSGKGLLVFVAGDDRGLGYVEVDPAWRPSAPAWIDGADEEAPWTCATSLAQGLTFLVTQSDHDEIDLHAFRAGDGRVETLYRVELPAMVSLAVDPLSRRAFALSVDGERIRVVPLREGPPSLPVPEPRPPHVIGVDLWGGCERATPQGESFIHAIRDLKSRSEASVIERVRRQLDTTTGSLAAVVDMYDALGPAGHKRAAGEVLRWLAEGRPADPHIALLEAYEAARSDRWTEVRDRLSGADLGAVVEERRQHAYHLLALALLRTGEPERATAVLDEARRSEGRCEFDTLLELAAPLPAVPAVLRPGEDARGRSPIRELREAVRDADACLHQGDAAGARAAIDRPIVWAGDEVQSLARLAEVELRDEPLHDRGRFRKALALARFLSAQQREGSLRKDLPLPDAIWPAERLADLAERAEAWLVSLGAPEARAFEIPSPADGAAAAGPLPAEAPGSAEPLPAWSLALGELDAALAEMDACAGSQAPARLAFRVRHEGRRFVDVEALLQRALRGGRFSSGQVADAAEILAVPELASDDADAAVLAALTEGVAPLPRGRPATSRLRALRILGALVGHPRIVLVDRPGEPAKVERARLGVSLVEEDGQALSVRFLVGGGCWTAADVLAHAEAGTAVDVDAGALTVTLVPLGAAALALIRVLDRHQPAFPPESHDELRRQLVALQQGVELHVPASFSGAPRAPDSRPVVRLTPLQVSEMLVEIGVRPVPGAPFARPGEGSREALGAVSGARISALRDLAAERAAAERLISVLPLASALREARFRYRVAGEERILAVVEALAEMAGEVVAEWPRGEEPWRCLGKVTRRQLRVRVTGGLDRLGLAGEVEIDGHRLALAELLEAVRQGRRYVVIGPRAFVALADDLRERLDAARDLIFEGRDGLEAGRAAAPVLADLVGDAPDMDAAWRGLHERSLAARDLDPEVPEGLRADLRPYQREGFCWLARLAAWGAGACLADDMGLGKTVQALAVIVRRAGLGPALVVAPTSVTPNWLAESARFAPALRVRSYRGPGREALLAEARPGDLFVAGYGVVTRDADALVAVRFGTLVLDEAHAIKNATTRRARAVQKLQADFRVALTGTPVENHLGELWSLFHVVSPGLLGSWAQFRDRFAAPIERDGSAPPGERARAALGRVLRPFLLRRTKEAVLPELPARIEIDRLVSLTAAEREMYETARLAAALALAEIGDAGDRIQVLAWLTRLRRLACHPRLFDETWTGGSSKLDALLLIVDELREAGHRALVFSQFTGQLALVREALAARGVTFAYLDGKSPVEERARAVESFQGGEGDLFLISLKAGGTGLNLTAADHVIHLDPWWNPAVEDQATDRAHRIGQTRAVTVIRLIAEGTIEEAVLALHDDKRELADRLLEGADAVGRLSSAALVALVRRGASLEPAGDVGDEEEEVGEVLGDELV